MDGGWNLAHHPKDNKVTGTFLSRTPQEVAHKGSQGNSTPGRDFLRPHYPLFPKGQPHLPGSRRNRGGWCCIQGERACLGRALPLLFQGPWSHPPSSY